MQGHLEEEKGRSRQNSTDSHSNQIKPGDKKKKQTKRKKKSSGDNTQRSQQQSLLNSSHNLGGNPLQPSSMPNQFITQQLPSDIQIPVMQQGSFVTHGQVEGVEMQYRINQQHSPHLIQSHRSLSQAQLQQQPVRQFRAYSLNVGRCSVLKLIFHLFQVKSGASQHQFQQQNQLQLAKLQELQYKINPQQQHSDSQVL